MKPTDRSAPSETSAATTSKRTESGRSGCRACSNGHDQLILAQEAEEDGFKDFALVSLIRTRIGVRQEKLILMVIGKRKTSVPYVILNII